MGGDMPVNWTESQEEVICDRSGNLLVSAAAGSGKTAVLVERIVRLITDPQNPVDIDRLLVITFTNAAASEMRERISAAIEEKLSEDPDDEHLQMQSSLIHYAKIQTIDSFCLDLIHSYFDRLDRDPGFRIGDEGELLLLRKDVMGELIEECYEEAKPEFIRFVEAYAAGKTDAQLESLIEKVYDFSQSNPYPALWFKECREELESAGAGSGWIGFISDDIRRQAAELVAQISDARAVCLGDEFLQAYAPALSDDLSQLRALAAAGDFSGQYAILSQFEFTKLSRVSSKDVDKDKKAGVTACRDREKKAVRKLQDLYAFDTPEGMRNGLENTDESALVLLELSERFMERYSSVKKERNLVDFGDLEHDALHVLIEEEDGIPVMHDSEYVYTDAADELASQFVEIMIDEYQDSNLVQETLVKALSAERFGRPDVFTVGDVKQSIYRFRLARPEIFLGKYNTYSYEGNAEGKKIELSQNFRSRESILSAVNDTFLRIMTPNLGNIRYNDGAALHPGAVFGPDGTDVRSYDTELLMVDTGNDAMEGLDDDARDLTSREIEARLIAGRIKELTDPQNGQFIWDPGREEYRRADYSDIVILLRSTVGYMDTILTVLSDENIPVYAESQTGYFNTPEVETILSLLSVIDNPMQDIPLAAVLRSPAAGLSDEELADMMASYKRSADKGEDPGIYAAMKLGAVREDETGEKIRAFMKLLEKFRSEAVCLPIHELITRIYEETGYYDYVSAMPAGMARRANLDMLLEKASDYEKTSYRGLFHFIRYMQNLKKVNNDFGEASVKGENENTVRIMSVHKSKGLEFPIVFLAGMGKHFNRQDLTARILIDPDFGIATDSFDPVYRIKSPTLKKNAFKRKEELESLGEELRVLYVAMTRAREKLIMTATDRSLRKTLEKYAPGKVPVSDGQVSYTLLSAASSYLDWILMSIGAGNNSIRVREVPVEELIGEELDRQIQTIFSREDFDEAVRAKHTEEAEALRQRIDVPYPFESEISLPTKFTVSELKQMGQMIDDEESVKTEGDADIREKEEGRWDAASGGTNRGTAFHRALQLLPLADLEGERDVREALRVLRDEGKISEEDYALTDPRPIAGFLASETGKRMASAERKGKLHRERQFVMGLSAREIGIGDSDEMVVIQGIIDAYFEEDDAIVLVDYKTDRVDSPQILRDRYETQLDYYARALTQACHLPVKEKIIYSLWLNEEIR